MLIGSNSYLLRRIVSPNMVTFASSITFQNHVLLPAMTYKVVRREDDDALDPVSQAQKLCLHRQQLQAFSCYGEVKSIGWQIDQFVEMVV